MEMVNEGSRKLPTNHSWCSISLCIPDSQNWQDCHHSLLAEFFPVPVLPHRMPYLVHLLLGSAMKVMPYIVKAKGKICIRLQNIAFGWFALSCIKNENHNHPINKVIRSWDMIL